MKTWKGNFHIPAHKTGMVYSLPVHLTHNNNFFKKEGAKTICNSFLFLSFAKVKSFHIKSQNPSAWVRMPSQRGAYEYVCMCVSVSLCAFMHSCKLHYVVSFTHSTSAHCHVGSLSKWHMLTCNQYLYTRLPVLNLFLFTAHTCLHTYIQNVHI